MVATASRASGPVARTVTCWPLVAPSPMTASTLLAAAALAPTASSTEASNLAAATASDRALHERGIGDGDRLGEIRRLGKQRAHRQHRAAEVRQYHHAGAGAGVGEHERALDLGDAGPYAAVVRPARLAVPESYRQLSRSQRG